jgi:thioester reductase-like protein
VSGKIVCLVRAKDDASAHIRIKETLASKDLQVDEDRLVVLSANVTQENLGLSAEVYGNLVKTIGTVIHAAWPVHFASSLVSFEDQIRGARNLINLVRQSPRSRFHFCSSIASVTCTETRIMEVPSNDPSTAAPIGYSQSKWVVEKICEPANAIPNMSDRIRILRIGQLCGDTVTGYWNEKEGWPLLIRTGQTTGVLPDLTEVCHLSR